MTSDKLTVAAEDKDRLRFADGTEFDVRSGYITTCTTTRDDAVSWSDGGVNDPVFDVDSYREAVPQLQLSLTDACNMGCTYCSFRDRVHADSKPVTIPLETVRRGIRAYRDRVSNSGERYGRVDFGLAGETMLVRHMHEQVHALVEDGLTDSPISIAWVGPNVTNATLSMSPDLADRLGPPQDISVDGPPDVHDRVRPYTGGRGGTYADVRKVLDRVLDRHPDMGVSAVLTAYCTDFVAIFRHLFDDIGARNIYMKPVNATHDREFALSEATLPAFERGYVELVDHLLDHDDEGLLQRLSALSSEDYLMRFVYRVKDRAVQVYRCGAGKSGAYVDTNGNLYACAHFIGKSGWHIGDVHNGFDQDKRDQFLQMTVDSRKPCASCFARYACGGGCHYQAVLANGELSQPDEVKCSLIRTLVRLSVRLVHTLAVERPAVLAALPTPYGVHPDLADATPETPYAPVGALTPAAAATTVPLSRQGRLRGALRAPDITAAFARHDEWLTVEITAPPGAVESWRLWLQPLGSDAFTMRDLAALGPDTSGTLIKVAEGRALRRRTPEDRFRRVPHPQTEWEPVHDSAVTVHAEEDRTVLAVHLGGLSDTAQCIGLNLFADLAGGGWTALALHEPFVALPATVDGPLTLTGPDSVESDIRGDDARPINALLPRNLVPVGRWSVLQPNVC